MISNRLFASLAIGVGSGAMYVLLMYTSLLWEATGPATLFSKACAGTDLFTIGALYALAFSLLHVMWSVVAFDAFRQLRSRTGTLQFAGVVVSHLAASLVSLFNASPGGNCVVGLLGVYVVFSLTAVATVRIVLKTYVVSAADERR